MSTSSKQTQVICIGVDDFTKKLGDETFIEKIHSCRVEII